jgi:hypothetical protein
MFEPRTPHKPVLIPTEQIDHNDENRSVLRTSLSMQVNVEVTVDSKITWSEITRLSDVSHLGAAFTLKRQVKRGRLVLMSMPMPRQLRAFDHDVPEYKIWAAVRRCIPVADSTRSFSVGVAFVGKEPPDSFFENPSQLYDISHRDGEHDQFWRLIPADLMSERSHLPKDDRKHSRLSIPEALTLQLIDEAGNTIKLEATVTENISVGGASVLTTLDLKTGSFLRVNSQRLNVSILSIVRHSHEGKDGLRRMHLEFIDQAFPLEGIDLTDPYSAAWSL